MITPGQVELPSHQEKRKRTAFSNLLIHLYRVQRLRRSIIIFAAKHEGGQFFSKTLRDIFQIFHEVEIGRYTYGDCFSPGVLPRGTTVGDYTSIAAGLVIHRRNHPTNTLTQHPFFYNSKLGLIGEDAIETVESNPLRIGSDVWIGSGVTILAGCRSIGNGAIVGAGTVVTRDIEPFSINVGSPAKKIRMRFPLKLVEKITASRWWKLSLPELLENADDLTSPLTEFQLQSLSDRMSHKSGSEIATT